MLPLTLFLDYNVFQGALAHCFSCLRRQEYISLALLPRAVRMQSCIEKDAVTSLSFGKAFVYSAVKGNQHLSFQFFGNNEMQSSVTSLVQTAHLAILQKHQCA